MAEQIGPMNEDCTLLPWDSDFWGFPVARLNGDLLTGEAAERAVRWCENHKVRCLYFSADGSCRETLKQAADHGFRFVDVRVDMEAAAKEAPPEAASDFLCRKADAEDLAAMEPLARAAHEDTRFFKDANFDAAKAADLYALWIARDLRDHTVFAAVSSRRPNQALGYLSASEAEGGTGRIGLVAVSAEARGRGLGRHLVNHALTWFRSRGHERVRVATQGTNVPALRLYEGCGFRVAEVKVWFHRWFDS
jgi:dTDP-4-amino-4,6-dideoxy-D-galactose acyltransferase